MEKLIGACGLICSECEAYNATQANDADAIEKIAKKWTEEYDGRISPDSIWCDGCMTSGSRKCGHCAECDIRTCVIEHKIENCAHCDEYGCDKITGFTEFAANAKESLEAIRKSLKG